MDKYRFPHINLPGTLYRVDFPGSQTKYNQTGCLQAPDKSKLYKDSDLPTLKADILDQYLWRVKKCNASPFIALFSSREAAESWGNEEPWRYNHGHRHEHGREPLTPPHRDWTLSVIDVAKWKKGLFFRLKDLVEELGLEADIPQGNWYYAENTYLCLHRVPAGAIGVKSSAEEVGQQRFERAMAQLEPEGDEGDID